MGNRIIKETVCSSQEIDRLTLEEEAFFFRLIVKCDDYGRMDARPLMLKGEVFPLRTEVTPECIVQWLKKLEEVGLIRCYTVDRRPYLQLVSWSRHQKVRTPRIKYPPDPNPVAGEVF